MDKREELQQRIFAECREILENLSKIQDREELIQRRNLISDLYERVGFLKISEENKQSHVDDSSLQSIENEKISPYFEDDLELVNSGNNSFVEDEIQPVENIVEEVQVNETEPVNSNLEELTEAEEEQYFVDEKPLESSESEPEIEKINSELDVDSEPNSNENIENQIIEEPLDEEISEELILESTISEEAYERNVEIIEKETEEEQNEAQAQLSKEKKLRLANIKGLKSSVQSLFDEEEIIPKAPESSGLIAKSNVPLDFMEAEKSKPDFKLDLNDRIAFTQKLFGGSQTELNETVQTLNSFKTLDEAKEYLSEVYYQRNWKKSEDYAQRLWTLVENKFL